MALVLYGGELAAEVAEKVVAAAKGEGLTADAVNMSDFKKCKLGEETQTVVFIVQVCVWKFGKMHTRELRGGGHESVLLTHNARAERGK